MIWLLGALVRLFPLLTYSGGLSRPLGMGGLYLLFSQEIARGGFALPTSIPYYTQAGLPYAYPPLAFYIEALGLLVGFSPFLLVNVLPALFSILTVGAFYLLARSFFSEARQALLATAIYALLPAAFLEHLPGEGLVESLGTLLFIGGVVLLLRLNRRPDWPSTLLLGAFIGLNVLASPGGAYGLALSLLVLWLFRAGGQRAPCLRLLSAGVLGLLLSAPYWLTVALRHGLAIFYRTFFQQHADLGAWLLAKSGFAVEQRLALSPWGILALIGLAICLAHRNWALPLWCLAVYAIPREFAYLVAVPLALLSAWGLGEIVQALTRRDRAAGRRSTAALVLLVLFAWGIVRAFAWAASIPREKELVTAARMEMMTFVRDHTPTQATFLVLGDEIEWFPVLCKRTTLNVVWGSEWVEDRRIFRLQEELLQCPSPACYLETARRYNLHPDYLYISRSPDLAGALAAARNEPALEEVWENEGAALFRVCFP